MDPEVRQKGPGACPKCRLAVAARRTVEHIYTGKVVTLRSVALGLALLLAAAPVFGVVCEMGCAPTAPSACHMVNVLDRGITLRGALHACVHNHTAGSPALLASASGRDPVGASVAVPLPARPYVSIAEDGGTGTAIHGPPGLNERTPSSGITVLRI
jgi:hypothetical protein